jgi:hypothetical protein
MNSPLKYLTLAALAAALATPGCDLLGGGQDSSLNEDPKGDAPALDHPPIDPAKLPVTAANPQRLSIDQLRNVLPAAMGKDDQGNDITWLSNGKKGLDVFSTTLGEADFDKVVSEDLTPTPLYLKFMDDAARDACDRSLAADGKRTDPATRSLLRFVALTDIATPDATKVNENLRYLKLRLHGVKVAATDDTSIKPLLDVFTGGVQGVASKDPAAQAKNGWRAVCVAMLIAPEFHLY